MSSLIASPWWLDPLDESNWERTFPLSILSVAEESSEVVDEVEELEERKEEGEEWEDLDGEESEDLEELLRWLPPAAWAYNILCSPPPLPALIGDDWLFWCLLVA